MLTVSEGVLVSGDESGEIKVLRLFAIIKCMCVIFDFFLLADLGCSIMEGPIHF